MRPLDHATPGRNGFDAGWFKFVSNIWWWLSRKHGCGSRVAAPALDLSRRGVRHLTCRFAPWIFFFWIPAETDWYGWFRPIQPLKQAEMGSWLPFFYFMWPCEREKKKKERKKKMRRHKKNGWKKNKCI